MRRIYEDDLTSSTFDTKKITDVDNSNNNWGNIIMIS